VLLVVLAAVVFALVRDFTLSYQALAGRNLVAELRSFQQAAHDRPRGEPVLGFTAAYLHRHALAAGDVVFVVAPGEGLVGSQGSRELANAPFLSAAISDTTGATEVRTVRLDGDERELLIAPLWVGRTRVGTFVATSDLASFDAERRRVQNLAIGEALVAVVIGALSAFLLLRRLLRTVGSITVAADEIGRGQLDRRLGDQGTDDEVGALAQSFDGMLDRIHAAVGAQRELLSDVSHQLRTPLTVARGHLEILDRTGLDEPRAVGETVALVIDELDRMRRLVDRLLMLGKAMEPDQVHRDVVDLRSFLADILEASRVLAPRTWILQPVPDLVLALDPEMVRGAVLNLVDNAVQVTGQSGTIALGASGPPGSSRVSIYVDDSGPGIDAALRDAVTARFTRPGAHYAQGSGLGLAIVKAVSEAHGGSVQIGDSPFGGARVSIVLPGSAVRDGVGD
jgi:signal transduction histidine kinase